jgi:hypothetical protein
VLFDARKSRIRSTSVGVPAASTSRNSAPWIRVLSTAASAGIWSPLRHDTVPLAIVKRTSAKRCGAATYVALPKRDFNLDTFHVLNPEAETLI